MPKLAYLTRTGEHSQAHLDGLNLSRAWMLRGVADALTPRPVAAALAAQPGIGDNLGQSASDKMHFFADSG